MPDTSPGPAPAPRPPASPMAPPAAPTGASVTPTAVPATPPGQAPAVPKKRSLVLPIMISVFLLVGIAAALYHFLYGRFHVDTDNAYVGGNLVQITPQVAGTVIAIEADDNDYVKAGQPLVKFDPVESGVALDMAVANLAKAVRDVRTRFSDTANLEAQEASRVADLARARAVQNEGGVDLRRAQALVAGGVGSQQDADHAAAALAVDQTQTQAAESALAGARQQTSASRVQTEGQNLSQNPAVLAAAAMVRTAVVNTARNELRAPVDGFIARRNAQVGSRVQPGTPLMAVVPLTDVWVDANYKEAQLTYVRIGQPVVLTSDFYGGDDVVFHGRVTGIGSGTGGAFALLPAQNATGNWIKVVQRLPVRISLDPKELQKHPLRIGLSMETDIDIHDTRGAVLASQPPRRTAYATDVFAAESAQAEALIQKTIAANAGQAN